MLAGSLWIISCAFLNWSAGNLTWCWGRSVSVPLWSEKYVIKESNRCLTVKKEKKKGSCFHFDLLFHKRQIQKLKCCLKFFVHKVISFSHCIMISIMNLYILVPASMTLTFIQDHREAINWKYSGLLPQQTFCSGLLFLWRFVGDNCKDIL